MCIQDQTAGSVQVLIYSVELKAQGYKYKALDCQCSNTQFNVEGEVCKLMGKGENARNFSLEFSTLSQTHVCNWVTFFSLSSANVSSIEKSKFYRQVEINFSPEMNEVGFIFQTLNKKNHY